MPCFRSRRIFLGVDYSIAGSLLPTVHGGRTFRATFRTEARSVRCVPLIQPEFLPPSSKAKIAKELRAQFRVRSQDCVAYGDFLSDAELFATVPVSVAVNVDQHLRSLASHRCTGRDL